jgi:phospholipid transport system substrate-binding protein
MRTLALVALLVAAPAGAGAAPGPEQVVKDTAARMFDALDANAAALKADPTKVEPLVEQILLPNFEVDYAARLVLANHWRSATPAQQQRFQAAFVKFLVRTYGRAIVTFKREQLTFLPMRGAVDPKRTTVQTEVKRASGAAVPVDYVLRQTPKGWKVFDVVIEGISYVRNYRTSFGEEIEREGKGNPAKGVEALIERLETAKPEPAKPEPAPGA